MKSLLIIFALLAVAFAQQDHKCPVKFEDSFFLQAGYFDIAFNREHFTSAVGEMETAIDCTGGNPAKHRMVRNTTIYATDGATGKKVIIGWDWILFNSTGNYQIAKLNDNMQTCTKNDTVLPIPKYSQIVSELFQIVPFGNESIGDTVICQGNVKDLVIPRILTLVFHKDGDNMNLVSTNSLSEGSEVTTYPRTLRPFDPTKDADLFKACDNAVETDKKVKLHQTLYEKIKEFLPTQN